MNQQELVEAVIKEVKRVLALRGVSFESPAQSPSTPPAAVVRPQAAAAPVENRVSSNPGSGVDLTAKQVIVLKDIQGIKGGVLRVSRQAVVTPMAIDHLRDKGVKLERIEVRKSPEPLSASPAAVVVGLAVSHDFPGNSAMLNSMLATRGMQVREFPAQSYESAIHTMCNAVAAGTVHFAICLEDTGMIGPIHANRNQAVRAVHCRDTYEARAARVDIGANVIVLDSHSDPEYVIAGFTGM